MERSEMRRQVGIGLGLLALGVLVLWQVAGRPRNAARAESGSPPAATRSAGPRLSALELKVLGSIYSALISGKPAPGPAELVGTLGTDAAQVRECLAGLAGKGLVTLDASGKLVQAPPFSALPTRHVLWLADGRRVYACCAWDALAIPALLECDATLRSATPQFERTVIVNFVAGRIASVSPLGALLWIPRGTKAPQGECRNSNLFTSPPELALWHGENPGAARGFSPALTQAKRTATERLLAPVQAALEAVGEKL